MNKTNAIILDESITGLRGARLMLNAGLYPGMMLCIQEYHSGYAMVFLEKTRLVGRYAGMTLKQKVDILQLAIDNHGLLLTLSRDSAPVDYAMDLLSRLDEELSDAVCAMPERLHELVSRFENEGYDHGAYCTADFTLQSGVSSSFGHREYLIAPSIAMAIDTPDYRGFYDY